MNVNLHDGNLHTNDQVKMTSFGGILKQYAWHPYKKVNLGQKVELSAQALSW